MQCFACTKCGAAIILRGDEVGVPSDICQKCFDEAGQELDKRYEEKQADVEKENFKK